MLSTPVLQARDAAEEPPPMSRGLVLLSPHLRHSLRMLLEHIAQVPYLRVSTIDAESGQRMGRRQQRFASRLSGNSRDLLPPLLSLP